MATKYIISTLFLLFSFTWSAIAQDEEYRPVQGENEKPRATPKAPEPEKQKIAPDKTGKWDWSRFRVGGNFGLSFGTITMVDVSPTFGYFVIPEKLQVGIGTKMIYYNSRQPYEIFTGTQFLVIPAYTTFLYGGGVWGNYTFWEGIFGHAEFELINKDSYYDIEKRVNVPHLLIGGGYMQNIGSAGNFYIAALFNVLDGDESIYSGSFGNFPLIIRTGFGFGFPGRKNR